MRSSSPSVRANDSVPRRPEASTISRSPAVACAGGLGTWWPQTRDRPVDNGSDAHNAERYLSTAQTGAALVAVLPDLGR